MTTTDNRGEAGRIGILWRRDTQNPDDREELGRLHHVFDALAARGVKAEPVLYADDIAGDVRSRLLQLDGVLVWVDPLSDGRDRAALDPMLRGVAAAGVWVSADPDVILKMGTKDVLVKTKGMSWGTDCYLNETADDLLAGLIRRLLAGARVLKQHRGNGGNGVWKVELAGQAAASPDSVVNVLHAQRSSRIEEMRLDEFIARCAPYFAGAGCMIDQPYQTRLGDGMVRCYLVQDLVAGFGHQFVTALSAPPGSVEVPAPPPRLYYGAGKPEFQRLKQTLEAEWVPEMQRLLRIDRESLPLIWDADFLYGPKDASREDTFVLCEINVSSVLPFPDEALDPLADAVVRRLTASRP